MDATTIKIFHWQSNSKPLAHPAVISFNTFSRILKSMSILMAIINSGKELTLYFCCKVLILFKEETGDKKIISSHEVDVP